MTAVREAFVLPLTFLTVVLIGGVHFNTPATIEPPTLFSLVLASLVLDAGSNALATTAGVTTDQRGLARPADGPDADTTDTVDIGAFEAQASLSALANQAISEDGSLTLPFTVGDADLITAVTATSSNTTLVPNNVASPSCR